MTTDLDQPIRLTVPTPFGAVGTVNSVLQWGVKSTLVSLGKAEWVTPETKQELPRRQRRDFIEKGT